MVGLRLLGATPGQEQPHRGPRAEERGHLLYSPRVVPRQRDLGGGHAHLENEPLTHPLTAVAGDGVGDLVAQDGGESRVVAGDRQKARVHGHLASRQTEGIHLLVLDQTELPLVVGAAGRWGDPPTDAPHLLGGHRICGELGLLEDLPVRVEPHLNFLTLREEQELMAARAGHGGAGDCCSEGREDYCSGRRETGSNRRGPEPGAEWIQWIHWSKSDFTGLVTGCGDGSGWSVSWRRRRLSPWS